MRKLFSVILILAIVLIPISSLASPAPLALKGKAVYVPDDVEAELVSLDLFFRIRTGFTSVNTSMVLKNPNDEETMALRLGVPVHINTVSKVRDLSISSGGKTIKAIQRSSLKKPPTGREVDIKSWYAFDLTLEPGESKVVSCSFVYDNLIEADGSETLSYPLGIIKDWAGDVKHIQIVVDGDFYPAYAFDPMPSLIPNNYHDVGRLTFVLDDPDNIPDTFDLTLKPIDTVLTKYMDSTEEAGDEIKSITSSFREGRYHDTLLSIQDLLDESPDTPLLHEVKYIESLCYLNLYELDKALALFDQLEPDPGFGESLSRVIKNRIIYDKFSIYKMQSGDDKAYEYLDSVKDSVPKDSVFYIWIEDSLALLAPPPEVEEMPKDEKAPDDEDSASKDQDSHRVIEKITIGQYEFYIEEVLVAVVAIILLIFIIIRIIKRRRRRRSSIFRY